MKFINSKSVFKNIRILYLICTLALLASHLPLKSNSVLYSTDYVFLAILLIAYVLLSKFNIRLNGSYLTLIDYVLLICYFKFDIGITLWFILASYICIGIIDHKYYRNLDFITENEYVFNMLLMTLSTYLAHITLEGLDKVYYLYNYSTISVIVFSVSLLIFNYILFCTDISIQNGKLTLITLEDGLYYVIINSFICTLIGLVSLYLSEFLNYIPIVIIVFIVIFISFALNNLYKLKNMNDSLKAISMYTSFTISKNDLKSKLYGVIKTVESIEPFIYCGIYFFRENHDVIFPICFKSTLITTTEDLKFVSTPDNRNYALIMEGNLLHQSKNPNPSWISYFDKFPKEIKSTIAIPIKGSEKTLGFILLALPRFKDIDDKLELLSILGSHLALMNENISIIINNSIVPYKNFDGLSKLLDYNIKNKLLFTFGIIEIQNLQEIITKYNSDFYEVLRNDLVKQIYKYVSAYDEVLCFEKENIFIVFNLLDAVNSTYKLKQLCSMFEEFQFGNLTVNLKLSFSVSEYPLESSNKEELLENAYKKLYTKRTSN